MQIRVLSRDEASQKFCYYDSLGSIPESTFETLDPSYIKIRKDLLNFERLAAREDSIYKRDLTFACFLYEYLNKQDYFNDTVANNLGFWYYLCLMVVPDIIKRRHGLVENYYYGKSGRIYLQAMRLYIHMSFQEDMETTRKSLEKLSTDYILQMAERTGRDGFYVEVYREIIRIITILPSQIVNKKINGANLFRRVLIQNTAKTNVYNLLVENKVKEYVKNLFKSCKVEVSDYEKDSIH